MDVEDTGYSGIGYNTALQTRTGGDSPGDHQAPTWGH